MTASSTAPRGASTGGTEGTFVPSTMQAVVQDRYGPPEVLRVETIAVPDIRDDEVLIRVDSAGLDRGTWHLVTGLPLLARLESGLRHPQRRVPGFDVSGTLVRVGANAGGLRVGDEVCGIGRGSAAEYAPALARKLVHRPEGLDPIAAGTLAISGITALRALRDVGRLQPGQHVLVYGASGGVGTYAVQIARSMGARVTAVCSSAKADMVLALGAERVLPYDGDNAVDALDGAVQYDIIIDIAGNRPFRQARRALAPRGTVALVGAETGDRFTGGFASRMLRAIAWSAISRRRFRSVMPTERGEDIETVVRLAGSGEIVAQIDRVIGLPEVPAALSDLAAGHIRGKVAVRP
jgi:NADPH:quinone reductase-like Zn-dependent oxidoreductase